MKNVLILYEKYTPVIDAVIYNIGNFANVECIQSFDNGTIDKSIYDLIINLGINNESDFNEVAVSHSLIPPFNDENGEIRTISEGFKVTGITIYYTKTKKIISQYPIFVHNDTRLDMLQQELNYVEQTLLPLVAEKILKNEAFETQNLLKQNSSCGGCSGCCH